MNRNLSVFLDLSRWGAAFLVVLGHAAHFLVADIGTLSEPTALERCMYFFTGLGHAAVVVFFVISGYLVGGITLNRWFKSGPDIVDYAASRFSRIYTVLVPALIAGYLLDSIGLRWLDGAGLYSNVGTYPIGSLDAVDVRLNPVTFVGNLLMLQTAYVTSLGSNGPLWSLAYEWWYYCIFCLIAAAVFYRRWAIVVAVAVVLALVFALPAAIFLWMLIWLLGTATFFLCRLSRGKPHVLLGFIAFVGALVASHFFQSAHQPGKPASMMFSFTWDFTIASGYCVLLIAFSKGSRNLPFEKFHHWAAGFSYSMYLSHFPVMLLLVALANAYAGWTVLSPPSLEVALRVTFLMVALYAIGYMFYWLTERHTDAAKAFLKRQAAKLPFAGSVNGSVKAS